MYKGSKRKHTQSCPFDREDGERGQQILEAGGQVAGGTKYHGVGMIRL